MKQLLNTNCVPLEKCDVSDIESLKLYREFLNDLYNKMHGDDIHAIWRQITYILTLDLEFRMINEAKRHNNIKKRNQNDILHRLIINGFVYPQYIKIGCLTEKPARNRNKAVYSLPTIIEDMEKNINIMSRENYICNEHGNYCGRGNELGDIERMHKNFDVLSQKNKENRSKTDLISTDYLHALKNKLGIIEIGKLNSYVKKYIKHTTDPQNRPPISLFPFKNLDAIYKNICFVFNEVDRKVLNHHHEFMPTWIYDPLEYLDISIIDKDDIIKIRKYWEKRKTKIIELLN